MNSTKSMGKITAQNSLNNQSDRQTAYKGKNFYVKCLHTFNSGIVGDTLYFHQKVNDLGKGIWMMDMNDSFQNPTNFIKAIRYIDSYCSDKNKQFIKTMIAEMENTTDKGTDDYCKKLAFFCELGVWQDRKQVFRDYYHKDFPKYFSNCRKAYFE